MPDTFASEYPVAASIPRTAHALRPVRIVKGVAVHYTGTTFPQDPYAGCELMMCRCECFGHVWSLPEGESLPDLFIDVLDAQGDILMEVPISRKGFEYLRSKLRFVRE